MKKHGGGMCEVHSSLQQAIDITIGSEGGTGSAEVYLDADDLGRFRRDDPKAPVRASNASMTKDVGVYPISSYLNAFDELVPDRPMTYGDHQLYAFPALLLTIRWQNG